MTTREEIISIETELQNCLRNNLPIDTVKLKRLSTLRDLRLTELVTTHAQRTEIMKNKTREMVAKLSGLDLTLKPDVEAKLLAEQGKYDSASVAWINDGTLSPWEDSLPASIAAGILVLACSE